MKKVKRNDPCPCGSGKKYKNCHGVSNVIELNPSRYNTQLEQLHEGLLRFAFENYEVELKNTITDYIPDDFLDENPFFELFSDIITSWSIFLQPLANGKTIFEMYYQSQQKKIKNPRVRDVFTSWSQIPISFYEIKSVNKENLLIEDILTNKIYQLSQGGEEDFLVGQILTGLIIPYIQEYRVFLSVFELSIDREVLYESLTKFTSDEVRDRFPEILAETMIYDISTSEIEFDHFLYERVADLFEEHVTNKGGNEEIIMAGKLVWKIFTDHEYPFIKKPEAYAAALDYVMQKRVLEINHQTQKELAAEYQVAATTVSKNAKQIVTAVEEELFEFSSNFKNMDDQLNDPDDSTMEQMMRDIQKLLAEQEFDTDEEMNQFLNEVLNNPESTLPPSTSPRDLAQDKLFAAERANGRKRKELIKEALEIYPNSPDAYLMMVNDAKTLMEEYQLIYKAVSVGKKDLGEAFFKENEGHFWGLVETRPFMRAKAELAKYHVNYGNTSDAITEFEEMLILNPNDNQGIRFLLFPLYVDQERFEDAKNLIEQFEDDMSASSLFSYALANYFTEGLTPKTIQILKQANHENPHIKDYLVGNMKVPEVYFDSIHVGDKSEAITYVQDNKYLWDNATPLLNKLAKL
ncbi:SEC-C domain-containing protein [Amphibacillus sp. MSJ-3]|uniref:SEC-C domain-containing protein n=1 Tax=Amphibacillus sp. MSJ-3 TaxID=2841505 RepID=UPI001C0EB39A|nr:SEC-C domain-containing protein [Amphibacillus sp. MSJ-3]MBU5594335.1 SEC-C domain-containing protein [Amphibacillus sp. MSJ-3]